MLVKSAPRPVNCTNTLRKSRDQRITCEREQLLDLKDFGKNNHIRPDDLMKRTVIEMVVEAVFTFILTWLLIQGLI